MLFSWVGKAERQRKSYPIAPCWVLLGHLSPFSTPNRGSSMLANVRRTSPGESLLHQAWGDCSSVPLTVTTLVSSLHCLHLSGPNSNVTSVVETSLIQIYRVTFKNHFHEQVFVFSYVSSFGHSLRQCIFFFFTSACSGPGMLPGAGGTGMDQMPSLPKGCLLPTVESEVWVVVVRDRCSYLL